MGEQIFGGKYRSESLIFEDKLGKVFKGTDTESGSVVFITAFDPRMNVTDEKANRVLKTNLELSELLAPQILIGLDAGCEGENRFIAAEGCEFAPLKSLIKAGNGLQPADALGIAYQICSALRNAAGAGINHLDLNSQNIFVDGDRAGGFRIRIARYGFSELVPPYSAGKKNDLFYGAPDYLAPEICSGKPGDHLSDIYSVGILMYEMITGKPPFVSNNFSTTIKRQIYEKPLPPNLVKPGVKHLDELSKLVLKATAKEPKHRPTDVTELMEAIAALQGALFPDLDLSVEPAREVGVVVNYKPEMDEEVREAAKVVDFKGHEEPAPAPREEPEKKEEKPRETMVFTGLVERIKEVEEELLKQQKKSAVEESPQEEIKTHMMQAVPGETAEKKIKPSEDWFVEDSGSLAEVEGEGEASYGTKKDSKTFFIIVGAVSILVIIALAIYLDNKSGKSVLDEIQKKPPRIDTLSENRVVMSPAPQDVAVAQEISTTPAAMAETAVEKPSAAAEEVKHVEAAAAAEEKTEPAQIKTAAVEKPEKNPEPVPEEKKPEIKPEEKPPVEKPFVKTEPKPAVKKDKPPRPKEQAPMTEEEKLNLIKQTLTQARAEYDKKNFKKAIDLSNKVLKLQPDNKLAAKLLEQSKAGMQ